MGTFGRSGGVGPWGPARYSILLTSTEDLKMTKTSPKPEEKTDETVKSKVDPAAANLDNPRPAPRWKPDPAVEEDNDLFNDMPV